jgi:3'(2'), 5'-bisphosphate nucleotidase
MNPTTARMPLAGGAAPFGEEAAGDPMLEALISLVRAAGDETLRFFRQACAVEWKDAGPVTEADRASHAVIVAALSALAPAVPIVSEEGDLPSAQARACWERFWLVDPLDGTKEFISGSGEYTVNIALIEHGIPVIGVVYAPALDLLYAAARGRGAWRQQGTARAQRIFSGNWRPGTPARIVESKSHPSAALDAFLGSLQVADRVLKGSSLKFCAVAEGAADLYPRFGPMMEWDAAAGDCVYRYSTAGQPRVSPLRYNTADLRIPGFVIGSDDLIDVGPSVG